MTEDTIVAIATPPGRGGIGVLRISGKRALEIASSLIRLPKFPPETQRARRGEFIDPCSGRVLDQVVLTHFRQPHSYTGEDVVEISCHGAPVILGHLLECSTALDARLAEPGEFTMRAFLNGRIDLTQAEAVRDLIESRTLYQARVAAQQAGGAVSARLKPPKESLVELIARLEAGIDFAEDDVTVSEWEEITSRVDALRGDLTQMARGYEFGRIVREGLSLAIVGRPNVGKSSLFNRLLNEDRAIVTGTPGTTRDLVSETASMGGIPVRLVDTAGIRNSTDQVERIGVEKSLQALADSDLRLLVVDASEGWTEEDEALFRKVQALGRMLIAINKCDLVARAEMPSLVRAGSATAVAAVATPQPAFGRPIPREEWLGDYSRASRFSPRPSGQRGGTGTESGALAPASDLEPTPKCEAAVVWTSALTGEGLPKLQDMILSLAVPAREVTAEGEIITNLRQEGCIQQALRSLAKAREAAVGHIPHEMLLLDLYDALQALDTVTGATTTDDLLSVIFSTFCVGK